MRKSLLLALLLLGFGGTTFAQDRTNAELFRDV